MATNPRGQSEVDMNFLSQLTATFPEAASVAQGIFDHRNLQSSHPLVYHTPNSTSYWWKEMDSSWARIFYIHCWQLSLSDTNYSLVLLFFSVVPASGNHLFYTLASSLQCLIPRCLTHRLIKQRNKHKEINKNTENINRKAEENTIKYIFLKLRLQYSKDIIVN